VPVNDKLITKGFILNEEMLRISPKTASSPSIKEKLSSDD
jgi:hypothetical protein